ncbi:Uracil-DNA glycosylase, partial [Dysosmobacter welbionis]
RGLLRCGLGAHSGNHLAVVQNRRPEGVDGEEQPDGSRHAAAAQQHRWMQAPAVPQLGP